uniref:Zinc transporter ZIP1 n=1 Tax=Neogobius melanostomus TaxID=47308 RepID=A0A8C6SPI7_9GOBI
MEYILQVKIAALVGLLLLTLLIGFIPARVKWFRDTNGTDTHRTVLSLISCFAGGVFLAACLLDIIPDYLTDISAELASRQVQTSFPLPEFIIAAGFFTVLILERLVLHCRERRVPPGRGSPFCTGVIHTEERGRAGRQYSARTYGPAGSLALPLLHALPLTLPTLRVRGLAIGLQNTDSKVVEICIAILVHKSIIVFSLSVKLVQSGVRPGWVAAYLVVFAVMSPLGIALGLGVMEARLSSGGLMRAVLEGLAAGTFLYITFMEILPHELNSPGRQLLKLFFLLLGFAVMAGLTFVG